jgi:hypothetical protein
LIPVGKPVANTAEIDLLGSGTEYKQYADDGYTKLCSLERCVVQRKEQ